MLNKIFFDLPERKEESKSSCLIYKTYMLNIDFERTPLNRKGSMKLPFSVGQYVSRSVDSFSQKQIIGFF